MKWNRREFFKNLVSGAAVLSLASCRSTGRHIDMPFYLAGFENLYREDACAAAREWFYGARFGLFIHYGLYSQLGRGEWVQLQEKIPVAEYAKLKETFLADKFDPDFITDLAQEAGMKYINMTARHHDSFCLFATRETDFNSVDAPANRDLVAEMTEACRKKGLGFFTYYSYGLDWRHPYFYPIEAGFRNARPAYEKPEPAYLWKKDEDFRCYIDFTHAQIRELLIQYKPLAGMWLDPIMGFYSRPDLFPVEETYALIRSLQPQVLISFKQGANGDEDFTAPERVPRAHPKGGEKGRTAWEKNKGKPVEICDTLQRRGWGYVQSADGKHRSADDVMEMLAHAAKVNANLLLNTGPLADGSIHPEDVATLREVGRRLRREGFPK